MVLAILAAAVIAAGTPPAAASTTTSVSAAATTEAAPASSGALSMAEQVRQLQLIYNQSCGDRAYGSFNDACDLMRRQIRDAEKAARKAERSGGR